MGKKRSSEDLVAAIEETTTCEIGCSKCDKEEADYCEVEDFAKAIFKKGWRATENFVYCPKCAKKYLK